MILQNLDMKCGILCLELDKKVSCILMNSSKQTHSVGQKKSNPYGLKDMHGNVWEWCFDRDPLFSMALLSDLKGEGFDEIRAVRGGSWSSLVYACRTANRNWYPPQEVSHNIGFRVALVARKN